MSPSPAPSPRKTAAGGPPMTPKKGPTTPAKGSTTPKLPKGPVTPTKGSMTPQNSTVPMTPKKKTPSASNRKDQSGHNDVSKLKTPKKKAQQKDADEDVPKYINFSNGNPDDKDEKSIVSSITMPKALRPSKKNKTGVQASLFSQVLKEEEEPPSNAITGILGLDPNGTNQKQPPPTKLVQVEKEESSSLCNSTLSGSGPPPAASKTQNVFRRIHGHVVAGLASAGSKRGGSSSSDERQDKDTKVIPKNSSSPRPSPRRLLFPSKASPDKEATTPSRSRTSCLHDLNLGRTPSNNSFLPPHLTYTPSDDEDESFLAELTTNAVGEVLSEALGLPDEEETRDDSGSESEVPDPEQREPIVAQDERLQKDQPEDNHVERSVPNDKEAPSEPLLLESYPSHTSISASDNTQEQNDSFHGIHVVNVPTRAMKKDTRPSEMAPRRDMDSVFDASTHEIDLEAADILDPKAEPAESRSLFQRKWCWIVAIVAVACFAGGVTGFLTGLTQGKDNTSTSSETGDGESDVTSAPSWVPTRAPTAIPTQTPSRSPTMRPSPEPTLPVTSSSPPASSPTGQPTPPPTKDHGYSELILARSPETQLAFLNPNSPQSRAIQWLEDHDGELTTAQVIQRFSLATLFYSLNATQDGWHHEDKWLSLTGSECSWFGVSCNTLLQVNTINLNFNNLGGTLANEVSLLTNLQALSLGGGTGDDPVEQTRGNVLGTIPTSWGDLTNLETLELQDNMISGPIPETFGQMAKLRTLRLYRNSLSSSLPTVLFNMQSLEILEISSNRFNGQIPSELGKLINLNTVALARNRFVGNVPSEIGKLSFLSQLHLNGNNLSGILPSELWTLSSLFWMALYNNEFQGTLPSEIGLLVNVEGIQVHGNQFGGPIPLEISQLDELRVLDLSRNNFNGQVAPIELQALTHLAGLYLHENDLVGDVPPEVCNLRASNLRQLWTDCTSKLTCACCTKCF